MKNIEFLNKIHPSIYRRNKEIETDGESYNINEYFVCVNAVFGYDAHHGYEDNILFLIDSRLVDDEYSIEELMESQDYTESTVNNDHILMYQDLDNGDWEYVGKDIDFTHYENLNLIGSKYNFNEDDLASFCSTFMKFIQAYGNFANDNMSTTKNQIYSAVISYYANGGYDAILTGMKLVLQSSDLTTTTTSSTTSTCCGQSTSTSSEYTTSTTDCVTTYENAMTSYLQQMLGDTDFYYDFFYYDGEAIEDLCNLLIKLIEAFKLVGYDLSFDSSTRHCDCSNLEKDNGTCNYNILDNYIQVLQWVRDCEIDENSNKIYVYGRAFGELLPKLMF